MNSSIILFTLFTLLVGTPGPYQAAATPPGDLNVDEKVPTFTLKDYNGNEHSLESYFNNKFVVVMFIATQCPVSNAYNERMAKLYEDYASRDVAFFGINSNKQESVEEIADHSKKHGFEFPVLKDWNNIVADEYGTSVTPEIYVIDSKGILRYHGRIDDDRSGKEIKSQDLRNALDGLLNGNEAPKKVTRAFGCTIKRVK